MNHEGKNARNPDSLRMLARHLRRAPRSVTEIREIMGVPERTAYHWIRYLREAGYDVVTRRRGRIAVYSVLPGKPRKPCN